MHDPANGLRRIPLPRTSVNKGKKRESELESLAPILLLRSFLLTARRGGGLSRRMALRALWAATGLDIARRGYGKDKRTSRVAHKGAVC
jgi:hypothetical protein